jgi:hypothetical protein
MGLAVPYICTYVLVPRPQRADFRATGDFYGDECTYSIHAPEQGVVYFESMHVYVSTLSRYAQPGCPQRLINVQKCQPLPVLGLTN